jgi:hypothetical protein
MSSPSLRISHSTQPNPNSFGRKIEETLIYISTKPNFIPPCVHRVLLVTLGFVGNPRRLGSPGGIRLVIRPWKVYEGLETTLRYTMSDWALTLWRRLKEKKVSLHGVWVLFVGTHTSPMVTSSPQGSESGYIFVSACLNYFYLSPFTCVFTFVISFVLEVLCIASYRLFI